MKDGIFQVHSDLVQEVLFIAHLVDLVLELGRVGGVEGLLDQGAVSHEELTVFSSLHIQLHFFVLNDLILQ